MERPRVSLSSFKDVPDESWQKLVPNCRNKDVISKKRSD
jgi:hypothetical protein